MATYNLIGARYLRKYTASEASPVYAAALDAQNVVDNLCDVPWELVSAKSARLTNHTSETIKVGEEEVNALDYNVTIRDQFDAALFCAGHSGGAHTAYANAAMYVYKLPTAAVGKTINSIKLRLSSDPYNSKGCRVAVHSLDSLDLPTACADVRTGSAHLDGAMPRTTQTVSGTEYWYAATGEVTVTCGFAAKAYLAIFVGLENYNTARGNWLEGSAYMRNNIAVDMAAVTGWTDGETYDLSAVSESAATYMPSKDIEDAYVAILNGTGEVRTDGVMFDVHPNGTKTTIHRGVTLRRVIMPVTNAGELTVDFGANDCGATTRVSVYAAEGYIADADAKLTDASLWDNRSTVSGWTYVGAAASTGATTLKFKSTARFVTVLVTAYLPIEYVNPANFKHQGTGNNSYNPMITIK